MSLIYLIISMLLMSSCAKEADISHTVNFNVSLKQCDHFLDDLQKIYEILYISCVAAGFNETDILHTVSYDNDMVVFFITNNDGYSALIMNLKDKTCNFTFGGDEEKFDFSELVQNFIEAFNDLDMDDFDKFLLTCEE